MTSGSKFQFVVTKLKVICTNLFINVSKCFRNGHWHHCFYTMFNKCFTKCHLLSAQIFISSDKSSYNDSDSVLLYIQQQPLFEVYTIFSKGTPPPPPLYCVIIPTKSQLFLFSVSLSRFLLGNNLQFQFLNHYFFVCFRFFA